MTRANRSALAILILLAGTTLGCVRIDSGHAGVKWTWTSGTIDKVYVEGMHFMPPWNRMYIYVTRVQDQVEELHILASNGLSVGLEISTRFKVVPTELSKMHREIGQDYYTKIIQPLLRSQTREVVARYKPEEIYSTKRTEVNSVLTESMKQALRPLHIDLDAILIRNIALPEKITAAIAEKLEEEQKAQKMKYTLERERKEAERKSIEAKGIADFQKIVSAGISDALLRWKGIEATQALALSQNSKVVVIGAGKEGLPIILGGAN